MVNEGFLSKMFTFVLSKKERKKITIHLMVNKWEYISQNNNYIL
jgi:hypothetical protein